jgi:hypothetical protein
MMSATLTQSSHSPLRITRFFRDAQSGSSSLWLNTWIVFTLFALCSLLPLVDTRTLIGVSVWEKPAKFFLSVGVHFLTLAWALSLVPEVIRQQRKVSWPVTILLVASWLELLIITARAFRGEASHFNVATPLDGLLYSLMGFGAVTMTGTSALIGFSVWRNRGSSLLTEAAGLGIMLGAVLTTLVAGYMASQPGGHWVGGDLTDATGLPFFHYSTTGGDLRVPHFISLHAAQIVPFAALSERRSIVILAALAIIVATGATFLQALSGVPLFRV